MEQASRTSRSKLSRISRNTVRHQPKPKRQASAEVIHPRCALNRPGESGVSGLTGAVHLGPFIRVPNTTNHEAPGPFPDSAGQPCRPAATTIHCEEPLRGLLGLRRPMILELERLGR